MNQDLEQKLVKLAKDLNVGETKILTVDSTSFLSEHKQGELIYFTATHEGSDKTIITGKYDPANLKRAKGNGKSHLIRNFVSTSLKYLQKQIDELSTPEDDLNKIYRDELGREYEIIDGIKTYIDERGFNYYLKYDLDGREFAWVKLTDGSTATFLDPERTILQIQDKAYYFDGQINWDQEMSSIFFNR